MNMKKQDKNKLIALFIVVMFVGSGIAFAVISAFLPSGQSQEMQYIVNGPLENSEEAYFLQRNVVVLRYYYSQDCIDCAEVEGIANYIGEFFQGWVLVEKIDVDEYPEQSEGYEVPTIYLKGKTTKTITEDFDVNEIYLDICTMFFAPVQQCSI